MKSRLFALLLCLCFACAIPVFAEEASVEADPLAAFRYWIEMEYPSFEIIADRAGSVARRTDIPVTGDRVTIHPDGSFVVDVPQRNARLSSAQPFGWLYYTQDYMAQQDQNDCTYSNIPAFMVQKDIHILYLERIDNTEAQILILDPVAATNWITDLSADDPDTGATMLQAAHQAGIRDCLLKTVGQHQYLVVNDFYDMYGYVFYETVVSGIPLTAVVLFQGGLTEDSIAFFEDALSELTLSAITR